MRWRKRPNRIQAALLTLCFSALVSVDTARAAAPLGRFPTDPAQVSVSGISSGAFMANQLHVAHSAGIMGAAMIAGGLYGCSVFQVDQNGVQALASYAVGRCMSVPTQLENISDYQSTVQTLYSTGLIDDPTNLARSHVYFFTGHSDSVVNPKTVELAAALYATLGMPAGNITFNDQKTNAGHSWVTAAFGNACPANESPYINNCAYDQAEKALATIYGPLAPRAPALSGRFIAFDQTEFVPGGAEANGMSKTGFMYVPKACEPGAQQLCRLHVALHGCKQSAENLDDKFYKNIGVNEWADTNRIVVLYPQAHDTSVAELSVQNALSNLNTNPAGCWNWWGYANDRQFLTKQGIQVNAIWSMIRRVDGEAN